MKNRTLGRTGIKVSPLCLGAMMFGAWGNPDHDDSIRIIHRALDAGINFIDTADVYSAGESEVIVGEALAAVDRSRVVLATKVHAPMGDDPNAQGNSRRWIIAECDNSLRRLGTDYIDLYQVHRPDETVDVDETLGALSDLVHAGQDPIVRQFDLPRRADRRGPVGGRAQGPRAVHDRAAALLDPGPGHRARRAPGRPVLRDGRDPVEPAGRRLAVRAIRRGQGEHQPPGGQRSPVAMT